MLVYFLQDMELVHNKWMVKHEKDHIAFEKKFLAEISLREKIQKVGYRISYSFYIIKLKVHYIGSTIQVRVLETFASTYTMFILYIHILHIRIL